VTDNKISSEIEVDLFGAPMSQIRERWGRPSYKKTKENQQFVALLRAAGHSQKAIARAIGCSEETLRNNFSRELDHGVRMIEAEALQVLAAKMRAGNVSAAEKIIKLVREKGDPAPPPPPAHMAAPRAPRLGKKEQLDLDAKSPPGHWGNLVN
jgi:lambda repressor-like predicted transcriptional regulator